MASTVAEDEALRDWKTARTLERLHAQQKQESNETVPLRLSGQVQVWIPIELSVVVHSLWESVKIEPESDPVAHDIKVWAAFLRLVVETAPEATNNANSSSTLSPASRQYLMRMAFDNLTKSLRGVEIHAATRGFANQQEILQTYFGTLDALAAPAQTIVAAAHKPSALLTLVDNSTAGLFITFGGQAVAWLPELRYLMQTYPTVRPLLHQAQSALQAQVSAIKAPELYAHGVDFVRWATDASTAPPSDYLASAPISWPLIGLTQLLHYHVTLSMWRASPSGALKRFKGAAGHSQGTTAAVVVSLSATADEFSANTLLAVRLLASIGARLQQATPFQASARADIAQESISSGWGNPTPMLSIAHLQHERLQKHIDSINKNMTKDDPDRLLEIGLRNGPRSAVVVGHPETLHALNKLLHTAEAGHGSTADQTRIPFSKRQVEFRATYLNVSAPFHSALLLQGAAPALRADVQALALPWKAAALCVPVYSTADGSDLRKSADLITDLIRMQTVQAVDWPLATAAISADQGITHVIDFGPGTSTGNILARNLLGKGVQVVVACIAQAPDEGAVGAACGKWALSDSRASSIPQAPHWGKQFGPRLIRRQGDGKLIVQTRMSMLLGKPPLMVAGMTPTTVTARIVAATLNAGYHAELAGGGLPTEKIYRDRIAEVLKLTSPGWAVTPNLLFLNQRLWGFQFPLTERLASEGWPIEGLTVAAGVPSVEKSAEIVAAIERSGMAHLGFKPGSAAAIREVVAIAHAYPHVAIILQWTGGRGGGHHSFEDFHEPILATYSEIRTCPNITLVGGSGFGDSEDSWPYLCGSWSVAFGYAPMPFDGILLGSRVMVSKEAATAREAKELLVQTPGIEKENMWEQSYEGIAGGVLTVRSELGEPIHKVATRGVLLWRELDREIFSLHADKAASKIAERKEYIIKRLNADYQKVYFGRHLDGTVCDLDEMTYAEVCARLIDLSFVKTDPNAALTTTSASPRAGRWLHADYMMRVWDLGVRIEERFVAEHSKSTPAVSRLQPQAKLASSPHEWIEQLLNTYPGSRVQLLCSEDVDWFIALCRAGGRKPVNFVPVIDKDLEWWFKKDSLWQSEDLDAVPDRDVGRVVILQGPVSLRYSRTVDEPVADILNGIHEGWVKRLLAEKPHNASPDSIPSVEYIGGRASRGTTDASMRHVTIQRTKQGDAETLSAQPLDDRVNRDEWLDWLAGDAPSWWRALLTAPHIARGDRRAANYLRRLFEPRVRTRLELTRVKGRVTEARLYDASVVLGDGLPVLRITCSPTGDIAATLYHTRPGTAEPLSLTFRLQYHPEQGTSPLHEADPERKARVKAFYSSMWLTGANVPPRALGAPKDMQFSARFVVNRPAVEAFVRSIGRPVLLNADGRVRVPLDFAIVAGWEAMMRALLSDLIEGDVLQLVHASNSLELLAPRGLQDGDQLTATAKLHELVPIDAGTRVTVDCVLALQGSDTPVASLRSSFLFRGEEPPKGSFRRTSEVRWVALQTKEQLAVLRSKDWINWTEEPKVGDRLVFRLHGTEDVLGSNQLNVNCSGTVHRAGLRLDSGTQVGSISHATSSVHGDVVSAFVRRFAKLLAPPVFFESGGYTVGVPDVTLAPADNSPYAASSTDFNPIHTNPYE